MHRVSPTRNRGTLRRRGGVPAVDSRGRLTRRDARQSPSLLEGVAAGQSQHARGGGKRRGSGQPKRGR